MSEISKAITNLHSKSEIRGGAYALFDGSGVLQVGAIGRARADMPLSVNSMVRVASISKLVTMLSFMRLFEMGKAALDSDISPQIGFTLRNPNFPNKTITPRLVLSHTSSVRDGDNYVGRIGETLESFFSPTSPNWANGNHWGKQDIGYFAYSNLGMGLIAQIIERATGQRFDIAAKNLVLDKLNIKAGFNWSGVSDEDIATSSPLFRRPNDTNKINDWVVQIDGDPLSVPRPTHNIVLGNSLKDYEIGSNGLAFSPQGGLRANIIHLVKLAQVFTGQSNLLKPNTLREILKPQWTFDGKNGEGEIENGVEMGAFLGFGTGIHILPKGNGPIIGLKENLYGHYGQAYGLLGGLWTEPKSKKGFAWFINGSLNRPKIGVRSGLFALEEEIMQAAARDLSLA